MHYSIRRIHFKKKEMMRMNTNELNVLIQKTLKEMEVKGYKEQTIKS